MKYINTIDIDILINDEIEKEERVCTQFVLNKQMKNNLINNFSNKNIYIILYILKKIN